MKKLLGIIFISLMFANIGFAEMRLIENPKVIGTGLLSTICVDGYKFVVASSKTGHVSVVQYYKRGLYTKNTPPQPVQCE